MDAASFGHARRDRLHVFDHPRRVPGGFGLRQRRRIASRAPDEKSARGARRLPDSACRGDRVDRLHTGRCTAQLAHRSAAGPQRCFQFSGRHHALHVGGLSRRLPVGCELSVRIGRCRGAQSRFRDPGRQGVRRQHRRRGFRSPRLQHHPDSVDRHAELPTPADRARHGVSSDCLRAELRDRSGNAEPRRPSYRWSPLSG